MSPAADSRRATPALDGYRGIAAVAVLVFHVVNTTAPSWFTTGPPDLVSAALHHLGVNGVSAFLVLSGFLVGKPFLEHLIDERPLSLRRYTAARCLRILPAWWVALAVVLVISNHAVLLDPLQLALMVTLQHGYDPDLLRKVVPPAWTLVIETSFYLAMPVGAFGLQRFVRRRGRRSRIVAVGAAIAATLGGSLALHEWWLAPSRTPHPDLRIFSFTLPIWADQFAFGLLVALAVVACHGRVPGARELRYAAVVPVLAAWEQFGDPSQYRNTAFALGCALFLLSVTGSAEGLTPRLLAAAPLRRIGWWSYGIYLWHLPLLYAAVRTGLVHHDRPAETWIALPALATTAVVAGWASYRLVESPALARIDMPDWWKPWRRNYPAATRSATKAVAGATTNSSGVPS